MGGHGTSPLARGGFRVTVADLDTQQTTFAHWAADRAEADVEPEIEAQAPGKLAVALREAGRCAAHILDGRPNSSERSPDAKAEALAPSIIDRLTAVAAQEAA